MEKQKKLYDHVLAQDAHIQIRRQLIEKYGINEAIVFECILDMDDFKVVKGENFWVQTTYKYVSEKTGLTNKQVIRAIKKLEDNKILKSTYELENLVYNGEKIIKKKKYYKILTHRCDTILKHEDGSVTRATKRKDFVVLNKKLADKIGVISAIIFCDLYTSCMNYYIDGQLFEGEWFYSSQRDLAKKCAITPKTLCQTYLPKLVECGLITMRQKGFPKTTYAKINWGALKNILGLPIDWEPYASVITENTADDSIAGKVTTSILAKLSELSNGTLKTIEFSPALVKQIGKRLDEGITEDELLSAVEHAYNYYDGRGVLEKKMHKNNLFTPSALAWLLNREKEKTEIARKYEEAEKVTEAIQSKIKTLDFTNFVKGSFFNKTDGKINLIIARLDDGYTETQLLEYTINRFNWLLENKKKTSSFTWEKLFGDEGIENLKKFKEIKNTSFKPTNSCKSKDGLDSESFTEEEIKEFREKINSQPVDNEDIY